MKKYSTMGNRQYASIVKDMEKAGEPIPEPISLREYSGKFMLRVPPMLHRQLVIEALEAHVYLNRYVCAKLGLAQHPLCDNSKHR